MVTILALLVFVVGCAQPAPTPTAEPTVLKFGHLLAREDGPSSGAEWWMDEVEKRSGGLVKFERYWSGSLAPGPELLEAIDSGIADVAAILPPMMPGKIPLHIITTLPGVNPHVWPRGMAIMELYERVPEFKVELAKYHAMPLAFMASSPQNLLSRKPVRTLDDLKGMKIRAKGYYLQLLEKLGAVPVTMTWGEIYTALQRGTIGGWLQDSSGFVALGAQETAKYHTQLNGSGTGFLIVIRQETFDSLPAEVQKVMLDMAKEEATTGIIRGYLAYPATAGTWDAMKEAGVELITLPPEEQARLESTMVECRELWVAEREAEGLPARKLLTEYMKLLEKYEPLTPEDLKNK